MSTAASDGEAGGAADDEQPLNFATNNGERRRKRPAVEPSDDSEQDSEDAPDSIILNKRVELDLNSACTQAANMTSLFRAPSMALPAMAYNPLFMAHAIMPGYLSGAAGPFAGVNAPVLNGSASRHSPALSSTKTPNAAATDLSTADPNTVVSVDSYSFSPLTSSENGTSKSPLAADDSSKQQRTGSDASPTLQCAVCADVSSGKHYGILACNGCSGFFKRSVRRKLIYRCQAGTGRCVVDKAHRNQCQACRLRKCLQMGMNKEAVQNERQPRNTATIRGVELNEQLLSEYNGAVTTASLTISRQGSTISLNNAESKEGSSSTDADKNGQEDELDGDERPTEPKTPTTIAGTSLAHASVYDTSARLLFMTVKWAKHLPSFVSLPTKDQKILLEEAWSDLFLLSVYQWSMPMDTCPLLAPPLFPDEAKANSSAYYKPADLRYLQELFQRFRACGVDASEFACLKAIVLFRPEARGLKDAHQVSDMQDQHCLMLAQNTRSSTQQRTTVRLGRLLLLLPLLRTVGADKLQSMCFRQKPGQTSSMRELLADMYNG